MKNRFQNLPFKCNLQRYNGGLADARNVGLRFVKGTWLCMLDSDDLLGRDYLHRAVGLCTLNEVDP